MTTTQWDADLFPIDLFEPSRPNDVLPIHLQRLIDRLGEGSSLENRQHVTNHRAGKWHFSSAPWYSHSRISVRYVVVYMDAWPRDNTHTHILYIDEARLLAGMAPNLRLGTTPDSLNTTKHNAALTRPSSLAHCHDSDGQAQANLGPLNGLRGLRSGDELRRIARDGAQDVAEDVLQAQHKGPAPCALSPWTSSWRSTVAPRSCGRPSRACSPKNRLRDKRLARLKAFEGDAHPYKKNLLRFGGVQVGHEGWGEAVKAIRAADSQRL